MGLSVEHPFKIAIIVNPHAASGKTGLAWPEMEAAIRATAGTVNFFTSERAGHARELARVALEEGHNRIVAVGGDGTLNEVVSGFFEAGRLVHPDASLAIVPRGTASDFARTLDLPRDEAALKLIVSRRTVASDVGWAALHDTHGKPIDRYFLNIAQFGLGGLISRHVSRGSKFLGGFVPYFLGVLRALWHFEKPLLDLEIKGKVLRGRCINVYVANGRYCGGGLEVAPEACLDSGELVINIIGDLNRWEVLRGIVSLYLMHYVNATKVWNLSAPGLKADADRRVFVNLDGEPAGQLPLEIQVLPAAVNIAATEE